MERDTTPPPAKPKTVHGKMARALEDIAEDLDATRDLALNGNYAVIQAVGDVRAKCVEIESNNNESHQKTHNMLSLLFQRLDQIEQDQQTFRETTNTKIASIVRKMSNGHAST